jgi:4-hydroxybenzoate polyprenyltransferase
MHRIRLFIVLARPAVVMLVALFTAVGLAQAGHANDGALLAKALVAVVGCLVFAVTLNDLADERTDRMILSGDTRRPLVAGTGTRREMTVVAGASAVLALGASALLHWPAPLVVLAGLVFTAAYSLRPVRIAERGVLAPMLLPAGYVAVPYVLGILAVRGALHRGDVLLLAGL